ncbi:uncharacterized protein FFB20_12400 [Fusarium fujikuroi]|nr:uncharacterized protein FFE2_00159 [Fusarium fujikuroi]SCN68842.1 uncharacterized protein FFC1_00156 [Fusarium fujikuroi]SCN71332.1 uncharacterized protein FFM5_00124 [Fusarium fujikuroi]SCO05836.1 uncharacterized protein FFB20_12400 [Fusarium fujikuroi]SCO28144.1 uncharacterized protein FFNC_00157 [Fusarium fujikuroi]
MCKRTLSCCGRRRSKVCSVLVHF